MTPRVGDQSPHAPLAGTVPMCFPVDEFLTDPGDLLLGSVANCPFYIDQRLYQAWHPGQLILDVAPGRPEGFSLPAGEAQHFVTQWRA